MTAIVGKNGSGKSSILNYIKNQLFSFKDKSVSIFRCGDDYVGFYRNMPEPVLEKAKNNGLSVRWYQWDWTRYKDFFDHISHNTAFMQRLNIIFYSNLFYDTYEPARELPETIVYNISTMCRIFEKEENYHVYGSHSDQVKALFARDMVQMIMLLHDKREYMDMLISPRIQYIRVKMKIKYREVEINRKRSIVVQDLFRKESSFPVDKENKQKVAGFRDALLEKLLALLVKAATNNDHQHILCFRLLFYMNLVINYFNDLYEEQNTDFMGIHIQLYPRLNMGEAFLKDLSLENAEEKVKYFFKYIYDLMGKFKKVLESSISRDTLMKYEQSCALYLQYIQYMERLYQFIEEGNGDYCLLIDINKDSTHLLADFINTCRMLGYISDYSFEWVQEKGKGRRILSSGEEAMLKLYARLYGVMEEPLKSDHIPKELISIDKSVKSVLVLLDEPEVNLHPQWQTKLLKRLLDFFKLCYADYSVQIIITSNTPFLISDLPKSNVIFMEKEAENPENCIVHPGIEGETFAQNIHTLLTHAFFMSEGTMGEFAKEKIKTVIRMLEVEKYLSSEDMEYIQGVIHIIGEPIIRNKLQEKLDRRVKMLSERESLLRERARIDRRLQELEIKGDGNG